MDVMHWRKALAAGLLMVQPAAAQDQAFVAGPTNGGVIIPPDGAIVGVPEPLQASPLPPPGRPGLLGWRRRHAARKRHLQEAFLGYPEEFNEWPLGGALYAHGRTQVANGAAARLIFNDYDFVGETAELNYRGQDKLTAVAARLPGSFDPVIIERTPWAPGVDQRRRVAILNQLSTGTFPVPSERVVVGPAIAQGLRGQEAVLVNSYRQGLFTVPGGGGSVSGFDGSGLSGSATGGATSP